MSEKRTAYLVCSRVPYTRLAHHIRQSFLRSLQLPTDLSSLSRTRIFKPATSTARRKAAKRIRQSQRAKSLPPNFGRSHSLDDTSNDFELAPPLPPPSQPSIPLHYLTMMPSIPTSTTAEDASCPPTPTTAQPHTRPTASSDDTMDDVQSTTSAPSPSSSTVVDSTPQSPTDMDSRSPPPPSPRHHRHHHHHHRSQPYSTYPYPSSSSTSCSLHGPGQQSSPAGPSQLPFPLSSPSGRLPASSSTTQSRPYVPPLYPLITRQTLRELDLEVILRSPQLRHDLLFDPGLQFRPTSGRRKRDTTEKYWEAIAREMETGCVCTSFDERGRIYPCVCGKMPDHRVSPNKLFQLSPVPMHSSWVPTVKGTPSRIMPLLNTLREVLGSVVYPSTSPPATPATPPSASSSSGSTFSQMQQQQSSSSQPQSPMTLLQLDAVVDPVLIQQELQHGVFDHKSVFRWIGEVLKMHCAPMRDSMVENMVKVVEQSASDSLSENSSQDGSKAVQRQRAPVRALRMCFEILEVMKLDIANHQLQALRPYLLETSSEFELKTFQERCEKGVTGLGVTQKWLSRAAFSNPAFPANSSKKPHVPTVLCSAMVDLVFNPPTAAPLNSLNPSAPVEATFPETLYLDQARLNSYVNDASDLLGLYMLIMLFRQLTTVSASTNSPRNPSTNATNSAEDWELDRIKREVWEVGPSRLGMCFDSAAPSTLGSGMAVDSAEAKWRKQIGDVILQVAMRAEETRERIIRTKSGSNSSDMDVDEEAPRAAKVPPKPETLQLIANWMRSNYKKDSALYKIMKARLHKAVLQVVKDNVLGRSPSPSPVSGATSNGSINGPSSSPTPAASGNAKNPTQATTTGFQSSALPMRQANRVVPPPTPSNNGSNSSSNNNSSTSPTAQNQTSITSTGLEPLMPEILHLGERIARLVTFHSKVYRRLYEVDGFMIAKLPTSPSQVSLGSNASVSSSSTTTTTNSSAVPPEVVVSVGRSDNATSGNDNPNGGSSSTTAVGGR